MSWLSENYDKAALGVAGVVALAVGYSVFSGDGDVPEPNAAVPNNTVEIGQREVLAVAVEKFSTEAGFDEKVSNGNEVQSFVSFPLYSIKGQEGIKSLTDDFEIHPGMPLKWWKDYSLDDYSRDDGPELDADKDGFTNREEYEGKTDPTSDASHPNYIAKLKSTAAKSDDYEMNWTKLNEEQGNFSFKYNRKRLFYGTLGAGGKFPESSKSDKSLIERFEILEKGQDSDVAGERGEYYLLKDNGKDQNNQFKLYYNQKTEFKDWTGTFLLDISGLDTPFSVPEGDSFSLPYNPEAPKKPYKFKSKKDNKVEIEYEVDGRKSTIELDITPVK
ncbi:MAG: Amuc_1099 family pilus-like system protein [Akkermansiaceae bacterium]